MNRAARRAQARCRHDLLTKTDRNGKPSWTVCGWGCGFERPATAEDIARDYPNEAVTTDDIDGPQPSFTGQCICGDSLVMYGPQDEHAQRAIAKFVDDHSPCLGAD